MEERRQYKRFHKEVKIHFDVITAMGTSRAIPTEGNTVSVDISKGGILFTSNKPIPITSLIECEIKVPENENPIYAKARVVRIEEMPSFNQYDIGIQFVAITQDDLVTLEKFIVE